MSAEAASEAPSRKSADQRALAQALPAVGDAAAPLLELLHSRGGISGWALLSSNDARVLATAGQTGLKVGQALPAPPWPLHAVADAPLLVSEIGEWGELDAAFRVLDAPLRSAVLAPVTFDGEVAAVVTGLVLDRPVKQLAAYSAPAGAVADVLGRLLQAQVTSFLARERADAMESLALTDGLTGLPNRRAWDLGLRREDARIERHGHNVAVVVVDLDELKRVNDRAGHAAGDDLLREAADTLKTVVRVGDVLARIGGDEFGIVAVHCEEGDADLIRRRVTDALDGAGIAASVGAAMGRSTDGSLASAWHHADALMYMAKRDQRRSDRTRVEKTA